MIAYLKQALLRPVHRHPAKAWYEWQTPFDPMLADLQSHEHGIVRRLTVEMVQSNGLILDWAGDGPINVRVQ